MHLMIISQQQCEALIFLLLLYITAFVQGEKLSSILIPGAYGFYFPFWAKKRKQRRGLKQEKQKLEMTHTKVGKNPESCLLGLSGHRL